MRDLAIASKESQEKAQKLISTALSLFWLMAIIIWIAIFFGSEPFSHFWFSKEALKNENINIILALKISSLVIAIRWPVGFYSAVLIGSRKIIELNYLKTFALTMKIVVGLIVLKITGNIIIYLYWLVFCSILEVIIYHISCQRLTNYNFSKIQFTYSVLKAIKNYTLIMGGMGLLGGVIPIMDRLIISKLLTLSELGIYTLIYTMATSISLLISSMSSVLVPMFAKLYSSNDMGYLNKVFDIANKTIIYLTSLVLFPLVFYGDFLFSMWAPASINQYSNFTLAVLAIGFWISASINPTSNLAIATNHVKIVFIYSLVSGIIYIPVLYFSTKYYGMVGAAFSWLALNIFYLLSFTPIIQKLMFSTKFRVWLGLYILPLGLMGGILFGLIRYIYEYLIIEKFNMGWPFIASMFFYVIYGIYFFRKEILEFFNKKELYWNSLK